MPAPQSSALTALSRPSDGPSIPIQVLRTYGTLTLLLTHQMRWLEHFLFGGTLHGMAKESQEFAEAQPGVELNKRHHELQSFHRVLYDAVGQVSPGLSEEAFSTLCSDARSLELHPMTLNFRDSGESRCSS